MQRVHDAIAAAATHASHAAVNIITRAVVRAVVIVVHGHQRPGAVPVAVPVFGTIREATRMPSHTGMGDAAITATLTPCVPAAVVPTVAIVG